MSTNVVAALSIVPILLAAGVDFLYAGLRPLRPWMLRTHIGIALVLVPLTIGVLVPAFDRLTTTSDGAALLSVGELVVSYGVLVGIWTLRTALESASPSLHRR